MRLATLLEGAGCVRIFSKISKLFKINIGVNEAVKLDKYESKLVLSASTIDGDVIFLATFIDILDYAMGTYGQVADKYQWEKISRIPFLGDLAKTNAAGF